MSKFTVTLKNGDEITVTGDFIAYEWEVGIVAIRKRIKEKAIRGDYRGIWPFRRYVREEYEYDGFENVAIFPKDEVRYAIKENNDD